MKAILLAPKEVRSSAVLAVADALDKRGFTVERRARASSNESDVVICWGKSASLAKAAVVINPVNAVRIADSPEKTSLLLHLHGIPVDPERLPRDAVRPVMPPLRDEYALVRVHVADLRILAVDDARGAMRSISRWKYQRIAEGACRAVYVLGLHFGSVDVMVHPSGRWYVGRVDAQPSADDDLARAYGASIADMAESWVEPPEPSSEAALGADPEFALVKAGGKIVYASRYVTHSGLVGYDRQSRANRGSVFPLAELRPNPSPSPFTLVANIETALRRAAELLPTKGVSWLAGSYPMGKYPTGGHIHFSGAPLTTPFLRALDSYLGVVIMLLEQRHRAKRRRRRYGRAGDFRRKEHGGFEYRVLPSWLVSPEATTATLALAKTVAAEWPRLNRNYLSSTQASKEFYLSKKGRFRTLYPRLIHNVLRTETGRKYRAELSYFTKMIEAGEEWHEDRDIKAAWEI